MGELPLLTILPGCQGAGEGRTRFWGQRNCPVDNRRVWCICPPLRVQDYRGIEEGWMSDGPLIVQSDKTLLLEAGHELAGECRKAIAPYCELERAPEHVHTYRVTPLALWNARAAGHDAEQVVDALLRYSRYPVPQPLLVDVVDTMAWFGRLQP